MTRRRRLGPRLLSAGRYRHELPWGRASTLTDRGESSMAESLRAQLLATLDLMPTLAWYATASGGLTYVNEGGAEYLGLSKEHPLRSRTDTDAAWDSHLEWIHPDDHDETRRVLAFFLCYWVHA